jgi:hypothetical protein
VAATFAQIWSQKNHKFLPITSIRYNSLVLGKTLLKIYFQADTILLNSQNSINIYCGSTGDTSSCKNVTVF